MAFLVRVPLEGGGSILVETSEQPTGPRLAGKRTGDVVTDATQNLEAGYQPLGTRCGRPKIGHYVPRQVGTIT